jgi:hypothetical protein
VILSLIAQTSASEPWVLIILAIIGTTGPVIAAWFGYRAKKSASIVVQDVHRKLDNSLGIPNGHGPLMSQTTELLNNQIQIQQNMYDLNEKLTEHIDGSRKEVNFLHEKFDSLSERIRRHVDWEERNKYKDQPSDEKTERHKNLNKEGK